MSVLAIVAIIVPFVCHSGVEEIPLRGTCNRPVGTAWPAAQFGTAAKHVTQKKSGRPCSW